MNERCTGGVSRGCFVVPVMDAYIFRVNCLMMFQSESGVSESQYPFLAAILAVRCRLGSCLT